MDQCAHVADDYNFFCCMKYQRRIKGHDTIPFLGHLHQHVA